MIVNGYGTYKSKRLFAKTGGLLAVESKSKSKAKARILLKEIMALGQINDHSQFLNFGITVCQRKSNWAGCLGSIRSLSNRLKSSSEPLAKPHHPTAIKGYGQRFTEGLE